MRNKWLILCLRIIIACIVLIVLMTNIDFTDVHSAFRNPRNPTFILLAALLLIPNIYIQWLRWDYLLRLGQSRMKSTESFVSLMGGMVVGFITPGRIGELGRSLFLRGVDRIQALGLVFLEKFYSFLILMTGGLWGVILLISIKMDRFYIIWPLLVIGILVTVLGILVLTHPHWIRSFLSNLILIFPFREKLRRFISSIDHFETKHAHIFLLFSCSLYTIFIVQFSLLALAFERIPVIPLFVSTTSTFLTKSLLPIAFGDLGVREGASIFFFQQFGVGTVTAFNSSILLFFINVLIPSLLGLVFLPRLGAGDHTTSCTRNGKGSDG